MSSSIGSLEFKSISKGIEISNEIVKEANVDIIYLKTICPGRFIVIVSGEESEVNASIDYGISLADKGLVDSFKVHAVTPAIIDAFKGKYESREVNGALGVLETTKVCAGIKALDMTLKSSDVTLIKIHMGFGIGGKLVFIVTGSQSSIEYGLQQGLDALDENDIGYSSIIRSPSEEMVRHLIK